MERALHRYRIMARVTGVVLIVLIGILTAKFYVSPSTWESLKPIRVLFGMGHGVVLYPLYLVTCFQLVIAARIKLIYFVAMLLAGFVPFLAFAMERYTEKNLVPRRPQ
jgi:integral membrane protein